MKRLHRQCRKQRWIASLAAGMLVLGACASAVAAGGDAKATTRPELRAQFVAAEQALAQKRRSEFLRLREALSSYPLYPYLLFEDLTADIGAASEHEVRAFLDAFDATPLASRLRTQWLEELARQRRWTLFLQHYSASSAPSLQCHWINARIETGDERAALDDIAPLWHSGASRPDACDPVFEAWRKAGRATSQLVWERIALAMDAGNVRLARYLRRFLAPRSAALADEWIGLRRAPDKVLETVRKRATGTRVEQILEYGMRRLARLDPDRAVNVWRTLEDDYPWSRLSAAAIVRRIGLSYAYRHRPEAVGWLSSVPLELADKTTREWLIVALLRERNWRRVADEIAALDTDDQGSERWRYWRARALRSLGSTDEAQPLFEALATERSYYGFLAADAIGAPYHIGDAPLAFSQADFNRIGDKPGIQRARELFALRRFNDARREWIYASRAMSKQDLAVAAKVAQAWGWHERAIMTVAQAAYWDDIDLRFPTVYRTDIQREAQAHKLNPAWVFAIARQESAFMPDARSGAGALGVMQLLPSTGRHVARSLRSRLRNDAELLEPKTSIRLGSAYLSTLLARFADNPILATAAYNAGPSRVERWQKRRNGLPYDIWLENVPFGETRDYLRRVLAYMVIYEYRLGTSTTRLKNMLANGVAMQPLKSTEAKPRG